MHEFFYGLNTAIFRLIRPIPSRLLRKSLMGIYNWLLCKLSRVYVAQTYFGARMLCNPNDYIQKKILNFGVWEPDISHVIENTLSDGDVFVDIGANVGYDTLLASWRVGSTGRVIAIEACGRTFKLMKNNIELNKSGTINIGNIRAVRVAVSDHVGKVNLFEVDALNIGAATTLSSRGGKVIESVDARPLHEILSAEELARLRLIKLDVEGAEPAILLKLISLPEVYPHTIEIIVEASPTDDPVAWGEVFDNMTAAGFSAWEIANYYDSDWYLRWLKPTPLKRVDTLPTRQQDLLFTRRSRPFC